MSEKSLSLPRYTVKRIMKLNDEVSNVSPEAVVLVAKATEEFLAKIATQSHQVCQENKRKIVKVEDLVKVIKSNTRQLEFLDIEGAFDASK